jgi:hypothetical protein
MAEVQKRMAEQRTVEDSEVVLYGRIAELESTHQRALAEAIFSTQQSADARMAEIIANKDQEILQLRSVAETADLTSRIAEAVQARENELKEIHEKEVKAAEEAGMRRIKQPSNEKIRAGAAKLAEQMVKERWEKFQEEREAGDTVVPREVIQLAVEEASKKKEEEFTEKLQKATDGAKNEAEMRNKLQLGKLQKQLLEAKAKNESYEKLFGPLPDTAPATPQHAPAQVQQPVAGQQPAPNVLQKLQTGRGGGIPRPGRGAQPQGGGRGRGQRLSGQFPTGPGQPRPAVTRPVPATASPQVAGQQPQRRQSGQQGQSQLPRPATVSAATQPFQPGAGNKRPREDEAQGTGMKRSRVEQGGEGQQ